MKTNLKRLSIRIFEISIAFLLFQQFFFPSELTFITLLINIITGFLMIFFNKKIRLNEFLISFLLFLILGIIISYYRGIDISGWRYFALYFMQAISSFCIFNYVIISKNIERYMLIYIVIAILSMSLIFFVLGDSAISSRFGHNGSGSIISYYIFNNPIYKSSNGTANVCAIASFFLLYFKSKKENKNNIYIYIILAFLCVCIFLCGSRKGMFSYVFYLIYYMFFLKKGLNLKKVVLFFVIPIAFYIMFFKVQFFYKTVGYRFESMINNVLDIENKDDGNSFLTRKHLRNVAHSLIKESPIIGHGIGYMNKYAGNGAENNILQIGVDYGIIAIFIYYSFTISMFKKAIKYHKCNRIISVFVVIVLSVLIQDFGSVSFSWQSSTIWYSLLLGVIAINKDKMSGEINEEKSNS